MSATGQTETVQRSSYFEEKAKETAEMQDSVVLPTGEVVTDRQHFDWLGTRHELLVEGETIRFVKGPNRMRGRYGPELLTWPQFDSHDEFRQFLKENGDDIVFHEERPGLLERTRKAIAGLFSS